METKRFGWALAVLGAAWLGAATPAEAGIACDLEICPDSLNVCVNEDGDALIFDEIGGCHYSGKGKFKFVEKKGFYKVKAKGTNDSYSCEEKAKVKVKFDPDTGDCVKKAKIKVGDEKREIVTPENCECDSYYD